jgi:hypothetical protein
MEWLEAGDMVWWDKLEMFVAQQSLMMGRWRTV